MSDQQNNLRSLQTELLFRKTLDADKQANDILVTFVFSALRTRINNLQCDLASEQDIFEQRYLMEKLDEWITFEIKLTELVMDLAKTTICNIKQELEQNSDDPS